MLEQSKSEVQSRFGAQNTLLCNLDSVQWRTRPQIGNIDTKSAEKRGSEWKIGTILIEIVSPTYLLSKLYDITGQHCSPRTNNGVFVIKIL